MLKKASSLSENILLPRIPDDKIHSINSQQISNILLPNVPNSLKHNFSSQPFSEDNDNSSFKNNIYHKIEHLSHDDLLLILQNYSLSTKGTTSTLLHRILNFLDILIKDEQQYQYFLKTLDSLLLSNKKPNSDLSNDQRQFSNDQNIGIFENSSTEKDQTISESPYFFSSPLFQKDIENEENYCLIHYPSPSCIYQPVLNISPYMSLPLKLLANQNSEYHFQINCDSFNENQYLIFQIYTEDERNLEYIQKIELECDMSYIILENNCFYFSFSNFIQSSDCNSLSFLPDSDCEPIMSSNSNNKVVHFTIKSFITNKLILSDIKYYILLRWMSIASVSDIVKLIIEEKECAPFQESFKFQYCHNEKFAEWTNNILNPARSINCNHRDCFDLKEFLIYALQTNNWTCPFCSIPIVPDDLRIDWDYFIFANNM